MPVRAVVVKRPGGPEVLSVKDCPDPVAEPGHVLVRVAAAGVNFRDIYERQGIGPYAAATPFICGGEGAGTVVAVGAGVTDLAVGSMVAWCNAPASYAELVAVRAAAAVPVPAGVPAKIAAAVILQGLTAHYLCHSTFPVTSGTVTVVHAAAGGVGLLLTQMIKRLGGIVVATTSSGAKAELATGAGADHVVTYGELVDAVRRVSGERGADVVYDGVGAATFDDSLRALRPRGMMVLYGAASGPVPPFDPQRLNSGGSLFLTRPTLGHYLADRSELLWRAGDLFSWIAAGEPRRARRRRVPAGRRGPRPGGPGRPPHDRQAAADPLGARVGDLRTTGRAARGARSVARALARRFAHRRLVQDLPRFLRDRLVRVVLADVLEHVQGIRMRAARDQVEERGGVAIGRQGLGERLGELVGVGVLVVAGDGEQVGRHPGQVVRVRLQVRRATGRRP